MKNKWLYDEFVQTGTDFTDAGKVESYDVKMSKFRDYGREAEMILGLLGAGPDDVLLDIGTGTGHFAVEASKRCARVCAADVSAPMLEYAKSRAEKEGASNIEWINRGFLTIDLPAGSFDCVVSNATLHHLPDFWKMAALINVHGLLKSGGRFLLGDVVFSCAPGELESGVESWLEGSRKMGDEFYGEAVTHVKMEHSTFSWIIEGMLERAGFNWRMVHEADSFMVYLCGKK